MSDHPDPSKAEKRHEKRAADGETTSSRRRHAIFSAESYQSAVEQQIREAQERGDFDNLRGRGQPLAIEKNEYAGDRELAYKMLKDNGFTLPWIEQRNELMDRIHTFRDDLRRKWQLHGLPLLALKRAGRGDVAAYRWRQIISAVSAELRDINSVIETTNTVVPVDKLRLHTLRLDDELERAGAQREI